MNSTMRRLVSKSEQFVQASKFVCGSAGVAMALCAVSQLHDMPFYDAVRVVTVGTSFVAVPVAVVAAVNVAKSFAAQCKDVMRRQRHTSYRREGNYWRVDFRRLAF